MAAQIQDESDIEIAHPLSGVQTYFQSVLDSIQTIPDKQERKRARNALMAAWNEIAGMMDHAQREIQNGDALIQAALAAATSMGEQRAEALKEIERLQNHLDAGEQAMYGAVMQHMAGEIGNAMGISPEAGRLLFDALIGDLDDFEDVHGVSAEQIHAFRGAMVAMLRALQS
jgi:DNA repair exonuclease SbcCD ATPase subunit